MKFLKLVIFTIVVSCVSPLWAQEGAEDFIDPRDIGEDVRQWAQNTSLKLKEVLRKSKKLNPEQKRNFLLYSIRESVEEAQGQAELLLMRFALNRALKLEGLFARQADELSMNYILLPAVKQAISLYERADLPYLEANKDKPAGEIEPPTYALFTKSNVGFLLTASNMNKTLEGQFHVLRYSVIWLTNDLLRSPKARRNPVNARIILEMQSLDQELQRVCERDITSQLNNRIRSALLESGSKIVVEGKSTSRGPQLGSLPRSIKGQDKRTMILYPEPELGTPICYRDHFPVTYQEYAIFLNEYRSGISRKRELISLGKELVQNFDEVFEVLADKFIIKKPEKITDLIFSTDFPAAWLTYHGAKTYCEYYGKHLPSQQLLEPDYWALEDSPVKLKTPGYLYKFLYCVQPLI
ncbi:MAG: hypothetical protein HYY62_01460 [Deltaproteobacteria bacterium]|nr:hypothetical protein [Deltaproteobacteria bacterium]